MSHQYITYHAAGFSLNSNAIDDDFISINIEKSKNDIKNIIVQYDNISTVIDKSILKPCHYSMICHGDLENNKDMWSKINLYCKQLSDEQLEDLDKECHIYDCSREDCFIYGFSSYMALFTLLNNQDFVKKLPLTFDLPCDLEHGDCCEFNVMQYIAMPLNTICTILEPHCLVYHYLKRVLHFIFLWSHLYHVGPLLNYNLLIKLNYDIVHGVSQYSINKLSSYHESLRETTMNDIKSYISQEIKSSLKEWSEEQESLKMTGDHSWSETQDDMSMSDYKNLTMPRSEKLIFKEDYIFTRIDEDYEKERNPVLTLKPYLRI